MTLYGIFFYASTFIKRHKHQAVKFINESWRFILCLETFIAGIWYTYLAYSFSELELEMKRSVSLEKVNSPDAGSNARKSHLTCNSRDCHVSKRRFRTTVDTVLEQYSITIKPKIFRSNSLSDLTNSQFNLDFSERENRKRSKNYFLLHDCTGDAIEKYVNQFTKPYVSWNFRGKKQNKGKMSQSYGSKFAAEYLGNLAKEPLDTNFTSTDNSSTCSFVPSSIQKGAAFPFKSTPSGNLKVQSNQVVFQSSTVGVLLADPTQAKVKVKFEGKASGDPDDDSSRNYVSALAQHSFLAKDNETELQLQYGPRDKTYSKSDQPKTRQSPSVREDKGKDLSSLGYGVAEPIDWMRVQLPKKQDPFQEFYRRIHNYVNTDTVVRVGDKVFHCHRMVLQIYSSFFDLNPLKDIELPTTNVTPEAFQTAYEWMIFTGQESNKLLRRDNILDIFCTAQYLAIKDLEDQCWSLIVNENLFIEDTAFALFKDARAKGMTPVMDLMVPRVKRFFLPLVASRDFLTLEPEEILTFLKSNYISVTSEIEVLMAGVRWLYGDWANRCRHAVDVMRCVRFGLISPWQLVDIKRNPDNNEVLDIVNEPDVQQMVDDGLAYVIIKYWYGNNSKNYYHWIDVLGLTEPAERNWIGEEKNHVTYKDFLKYLEQFMVPREQMYQQMAMMQATRRNDDMPGSMRSMDNDNMEMRRPKMDFPLPATLKGLAGDRDKSFPTMSEFFESRRKKQDCSHFSPPNRPPPLEVDHNVQSASTEHSKSPMASEVQQKQHEELKRQLEQNLKLQNMHRHKIQQIHMCTVEQESVTSTEQAFDPPERDSEEINTASETSSGTLDNSAKIHLHNYIQNKEKRHSVAASYLAAATAALAVSGRQPKSTSRRTTNDERTAATNASRVQTSPMKGATQPSNIFSPQISLFNHSKESLARINMNKLSTSILGPSNKKYISDGSLFNWDRETVLVFGGIDPHTAYGLGGNTGKDIFRFDPVTNVWESVGQLPEPRHHHSVAFLRGRVYLVGGADPRDDDIRGKSVVVSTVWSYEPVTRSWYSESGLAVPRKNFGLIVHRMALYAIGGQDMKGRVLRSVERFDLKSTAWSEVKSMGVARMAVACTKYREYIWVAGGMTGEKKKPVCKIVECYNSTTNEWTEIHSLRFPRCFATLFAMNDKLYIIGGAGKVSDKDKTASSVAALDVWDWKNRQWCHETEMSMPRHGHALAYLGTQLIIIGGVTTIYMRALNNVESYCCERGAWIRGVAALPTPLSGHGAVTLPPASLM